MTWLINNLNGTYLWLKLKQINCWYSRTWYLISQEKYVAERNRLSEAILTNIKKHGQLGSIPLIAHHTTLFIIIPILFDGKVLGNKCCPYNGGPQYIRYRHYSSKSFTFKEHRVWNKNVGFSKCSMKFNRLSYFELTRSSENLLGWKKLWIIDPYPAEHIKFATPVSDYQLYAV